MWDMVCSNLREHGQAVLLEEGGSGEAVWGIAGLQRVQGKGPQRGAVGGVEVELRTHRDVSGAATGMPRWQKKLLQDRRGRVEFAALLRVTEIPGVSSKAARAQRAGESCTQLFSYCPLYVAFVFFRIQKP